MKPMLASNATDDAIRRILNVGPLLASPKLDGIRGVVVNGQLLSRSLKPIRNTHVQNMFGRLALNGLDGELILGEPTAKDVYRRTNSAVMTITGEPDIYFYIFDTFINPNMSYLKRKLILPNYQGDNITYLIDKEINTVAELESYEEKVLEWGYEGVIIRKPTAPYKFGRATANQGYLLKLKRFLDSEAEVLNIIELMHNDNEAQVNELSRTFRSTSKAGLIGMDTMGAILVKDINTGQEFKIGTGFSAEERNEIWQNKSQILGLIVKYKFFNVGVKDLPRHPVFLGWRDEEDM